MAWTAEHLHAAADGGYATHPSDLTDAELALMVPLISSAKHGGRPRKVDVREVLNAVFYVLSTGHDGRRGRPGAGQGGGISGQLALRGCEELDCGAP
jgi:hypothetical protein